MLDISWINIGNNIRGITIMFKARNVSYKVSSVSSPMFPRYTVDHVWHQGVGGIITHRHIHNCIPGWIRNLKKENCSVDKFKKHLDDWLKTVPDQPRGGGYSERVAAESNSIQHQAGSLRNRRWPQGVAPLSWANNISLWDSESTKETKETKETHTHTHTHTRARIFIYLNLDTPAPITHPVRDLSCYKSVWAWMQQWVLLHYLYLYMLPWCVVLLSVHGCCTAVTLCSATHTNSD